MALSLEGRIEPSKKTSKSLTIPGSSAIVRKSLSHEPGDVGRIDLQTLIRLTGPRGDARLEVQEELFLSKGVLQPLLHSFIITLNIRR
ncbi:unnamed protein product [Merluccius merluccius]